MQKELTMSNKFIKNKMLGCLYGQAIGNAMGITTEFYNKAYIKKQYPDGVVAYLNDSGVWEDDDTNQMLCILDELISNGYIQEKSLARRLLIWLKEDGRGCGNLVHQVLRHRDYLAHPIVAAKERWELAHCNAAPNGAIMRTSVVGLLPRDVVTNAETACKLTHYDPRCVGSCVIASSIIHNLVWNDRQLTCDEIKAIGLRYDERIAEWVDLAYLSKDISMLDLDEPASIGYTLRTLSAALWCYFHAPSFETGLLLVVNEGGDADTNAAISCAILGAKFGYDSIPPYYVENLYNESFYREKVNCFIDKVLYGQK